MTARNKLAEARFFSDKMSRTEIGSTEFRFYASASVSAFYSSTQHLLYDYARKFWPSITAKEYVDAEHLTLLAKATGNEKATKFVGWYNKLWGRMKQNDEVKAVLEARTMEIHRGSPPLLFDVSLLDQVDITDQLEYGVMSPRGVFSSSGSRLPTPEQIHAVPGNRTAVFFPSYKTKQVLDTLSSAIDFVEKLVDEAESQFGSP
ncbi:MAG: hypothetical protein ABSF63_09040 [Candidatus Bathyarchaeia archaeon]|jgi:hypothetical protein